MIDALCSPRPPRLAGALVALGLARAAPTARAQPTPTPPPSDGAVKPLAESLTGMAKAEYEAGKVLYGDKDWLAAIAKFQRAYDLSHDSRLLWNVAVCEKNLRRYTKMLGTIKRYQKEGANVLSTEERAQAEEIVKTVQEFISTLDLSASEAGADVFIDGDKVGTTPLPGPLTVDVGKRVLRVSKSGWRTVEQTLEVAGGGKLALTLKLERELHRGRLRVAVGPNDTVSLDGKAVGRGPWEGSLPSGGHTLRVTSPGMAAYQSEVLVRDGEQRKVDVTLNPLPKTDTTTTILWIAGGVALVAGAAISGAILFEPTEAPTVRGTISPGTVQLGFGRRRR